MRIAEIFCSVQGEGILTGVPTAFVRTTGCPLRCAWCDSPYTSWEPEGEALAVEEVLGRLSGFGVRHVVVTGGEPMQAVGIDELCAALRAAGYHITIETAAIAFRAVACDLASLSPKLSNSTPRDRAGGRYAERHDRLRLRPDVIADWLAHCPCQLKFVLAQPADIAEVLDLLARLPPVEPDRVLLMPQGVTREELAARGGWVVELCKQHGFRYCPRIHIELYGNRRGT